MSIQPTTTTAVPVYVKATRKGENYRLHVTAGDVKILVTVTALQVIEWTDEKGWTFGINEHGVLTDESKGGFYARGEDIHDYISTCLSGNDWAEFAATLPAYQKLPTAPAKKTAPMTKRAWTDRFILPGPKAKPSPYPAWWAYDTYGKWVKVEGKTVRINPDDLGRHLLGTGFFAGCDDHGYYVKGWGNRPRVYVDPRSVVAGAWNDAEWWEYAKTITAK